MNISIKPGKASWRRAAALSAVVLALSSALTGCGNSSGPDDGSTGGTTGGTTSGTTGGSTGGTTGGTTSGTTGGLTGGTTGGASTGNVYIAFDGGGDVGTTDTYSADLSTRIASFNTGLNEGIIDRLGTLQAIGQIGGVATLRQMDNFATRGNAAFDSTQDREFVFPGVIAPRGTAITGLTRNSLIIADASAVVAGEDPATVPSMHVVSNVFGLLPSPTILETITVAVAGGRTWDVIYDTLRDRVYAAMTNGSVAVYDNFASRVLVAALGGPDVAPSRVITPGAISGGNSATVSTNLHGIDYNATTDQLVVSDVGSATSDSDGRIYVIDNASTAGNVATGTGPGIVVPSRTLAGGNTRLGNPVDLLLRDDGSLYVAEKLNGGGQILVFNAILGGASGDIAPNRRVTTSDLGSVGGPESIAAAVN